MEIAAICRHQGEEPVLGGKNGICNVFFAHCTMQCRYCQNYQISRNQLSHPNWKMSVEEAVRRISTILDQGVHYLGFVSPTHYIPHMLAIIEKVKAHYSPIIVYNSNGYERVEILRALENHVDIFLPDFKYADNQLSLKYSATPDYFPVALQAIAEMYRRKGSMIYFDEQGLALKGMIVRHLVLPGFLENSIKVLETLAYEISQNIYLSLMSQYNPMENMGLTPPLDRCLTTAEYHTIVDKMQQLGFKNGWIQELDSSHHYSPDFCQPHPFISKP
jgi:putative pyruvate formate lyase activating enzyme